MRAIYHLARADFFERTRRYSFLIIMGVVVWAGYMMLPSNPSTYITMHLSGHRGIYNSPYVGAIISIMGSIYLALVGFYLVKNAIRRDRISGVGEIIAGTPISRASYTIGKMLSNIAVLASIVAVLMAAAAVTQLIRGESTTIDLWGLASPFLFITIPIACVVAGVAVLFETLPYLRGGVGNVVYYFVWTFALILEIEAGASIFGHSIFVPSIQQACAAAFPDYSLIERRLSTGILLREGGYDLTMFTWDGMTWTAKIILSRLWFVAGGLVITLVAALVFDRFDSTTTTRTLIGFRDRAGDTATPVTDEETADAVPAQPTSRVALTPLTGRETARSRFIGVLRAELTLLLRRHGMWWKLVALGLIVGSILFPIDLARKIIWPGAFIWPILVWSSLGWRERRYRVDQIVFATRRPVMRQLFASWLAAVLVTAVVSAGMGIRLAIAGDAANLGMWLVGIVFVPSLGLALGVLTGSGKFFEIFYLLIWYAGPMSQAPPLDYVGMLEGTGQTLQPVYYLIATVVLIGAALTGRWRQMR